MPNPQDLTTSRDISFWDPNDPNWKGQQWRAARKGAPEPGDADYSWDQPYDNKAERMLGEARYTLSKGDSLVDDTARQGQRDANAESDAVQREHAAGMPISPRGLTNYTDLAASALGAAAFAPTPASPALMLASGLLGAPGGVRRMLSPDSDESSGAGMVQTGMSLAGMLPSMRGFRTAGKIAQDVSPEVNAMGSKLSKYYGGVGKNSGNLGEDMAGLVGGRGGRTDDVIDEVIDGPMSGLEMPSSWKMFESATPPKVPTRGPRPSRARPFVDTTPGPTKDTVKAMLAKMNQESGAGYRTVAPSNPNQVWPKELPDGGLDSLPGEMAARLGKAKAPSTMNDFTEFADDGADWGPDLLSQLAQRERRLSIPARSRAFRNNTVVD